MTAPTTDTPRPIILRNARIIDPARNLDARGSVAVADRKIVAAGPDADAAPLPANAEIVDVRGAVIAPGIIDMRVFLGEPGSEHRETLASAGEAAAAGGVTSLVTMPDTEPAIDDAALVDYLARRARDTTGVRVFPAAALTRGLHGKELTEFGLLQEAGAVFFTDGRKSLASSLVMRRALTYARDFGLLIANQPLDASLAGSGVMNEGETASRLGLPGIPKEAEIIMLERDLRLVKLSRGRYHAAQISCRESLDLIRSAKRDGLDVTAGVSINHLSLNENDIGSYRTFLKLSPPLRHEDDRIAMVEGVADGSIDVIVSAHDPQDVDMKRHPFAEAADGSVGLETMLPAALRLFHDGSIDLLTLFGALSTRPARLLGLDLGTLSPGAPADFIVVDTDIPFVLDAGRLLSRCKNTPFDGARFQGRAVRTVVGGKTIYTHG